MNTSILPDTLLVLEVIVGVLVLITAVVTARTRKDVQEVHLLVNDRMDKALAYIAALTAALVDADVDVPLAGLPPLEVSEGPRLVILEDVGPAGGEKGAQK